MFKKILPFIVVALVVGGASFYAGMTYQKSQRITFSAFNGSATGGSRPFGVNGSTSRTQTRGSGFQPVSGEIVSTDGATMTVKTRDGSSKIIIISDSTTINKSAPGSKTDLVKGESIMVIGSADTSGAITAQTISIGQINMVGGMPPSGNDPSGLTPPAAGAATSPQP